MLSMLHQSTVILLLIHDGDFFEFFGGFGGVEVLPIPSVKGEYGAVTAWGGALAPA